MTYRICIDGIYRDMIAEEIAELEKNADRSTRADSDN